MDEKQRTRPEKTDSDFSSVAEIMPSVLQQIADAAALRARSTST